LQQSQAPAARFLPVVAVGNFRACLGSDAFTKVTPRDTTISKRFGGASCLSGCAVSVYLRNFLMLSGPRQSVAGCIVLGCVVIAGCSARTPATMTASPVTGETRNAATFSLNTPLERIAADRSGKAILVRDIPGLMASPDYDLVDDMSLAQIATVSGGQLSTAKLDLVQTDLAKLHQSKP
jgi:hypothetical protein